MEDIAGVDIQHTVSQEKVVTELNNWFQEMKNYVRYPQLAEVVYKTFKKAKETVDAAAKDMLEEVEEDPSLQSSLRGPRGINIYIQVNVIGPLGYREDNIT